MSREQGDSFEPPLLPEDRAQGGKTPWMGRRGLFHVGAPEKDSEGGGAAFFLWKQRQQLSVVWHRWSAWDSAQRSSQTGFISHPHKCMHTHTCLKTRAALPAHAGTHPDAVTFVLLRACS